MVRTDNFSSSLQRMKGLMDTQKKALKSNACADPEEGGGGGVGDQTP